MIFSIANVQHAEEINQLVNSAYRGESSKAGWTTEADLLGGQRSDPEGLKEIIQSENQIIILGRDENSNELLACVHLTLTSDGVYLGMLTTRPTLQGSGLGKKMLNEAENRTRAWNAKRIFMSVIEVRKELISFYLRRGFQLTNQFKDFPYGDERFGLPKRDDLRFVIMEKFL